MGRPRKHDIDDQCFSQDTPERNYWVGFLMADGCIIDRGPSQQDKVKVAVHEQDEQHLITFLRFIGSDAEPLRYTNTNDTPVVEITFPSQPIVDTLATFGVTTRKSLTARAQHLETDPDFWRGVIDGDGWIGTGKYRQLELVGSQDLVTQFVVWVGTVLPPQKTQPRVRANKSIFRVNLSHSRLLHLLPVLYYEGCVAMERKYLRAREIINTPLLRNRTF